MPSPLPSHTLIPPPRQPSHHQPSSPPPWSSNHPPHHQAPASFDPHTSKSQHQTLPLPLKPQTSHQPTPKFPFLPKPLAPTLLFQPALSKTPLPQSQNQTTRTPTQRRIRSTTLTKTPPYHPPSHLRQTLNKHRKNQPCRRASSP